MRTHCLAFILTLATAAHARAEGLFIIHNRTDQRIEVKVSRNREPKNWATIVIPQHDVEWIRLVSQDYFDIRIFNSVGDVIEEYGVNRMDLHGISDTPGGGHFVCELNHWRTWKNGQPIELPKPYQTLTTKMYGRDGVVKVTFSDLRQTGHDIPPPPPPPPKRP